jgi:uncharacterized protein
LLIPEVTFYLAAVPAVFIVGLSKAGVGAGMGLLAVPILSLVVSPAKAAGILLPILCLMDLLGFRQYRKYLDWELFKSLLPGSVLGIAIAALTFRFISVSALQFMIGLECLLFAGNQLVNRRRIAAAHPSRRTALKAFVFASLSGFTSTVAHAGSPPLAHYLVPLRLEKLQYVAVSVCFFTAVNYLKLVPYGWLGLINFSDIWISLSLMPIVPAAFWLGVRVVKRVPEIWFFRILIWSLFLLGIRLLWQALG